MSILQLLAYYCGLGLKGIALPPALPPGGIAVTSAPIYKGEFKTKLRLSYQEITSPEFSGSINMSQFESEFDENHNRKYFPEAFTLNSNACIKSIFLKTDSSYKKTYKKTEINNEYGLMHTIDSSNYSIIRRWTSKGSPITESVQNKLTNIELLKNYYENGVLKQEGYMTSIAHAKIGRWKFYDNRGKLTKEIDFDKQYGFSYCNFLNLVITRNLYDYTTEISFDTKKKIWTSYKWALQNGYSEGKGISYNVRTKKIKEVLMHGIH